MQIGTRLDHSKQAKKEQINTDNEQQQTLSISRENDSFRFQSIHITPLIRS
jgi:hypothetical protein